MAPLMSPTCKLWDLIVVGGLEQASPVNVIFLSIAKVKACWRAILTCYLKNWMQKNKDKWPFDLILWKKWAQSLMKLSISRLCAPCTSMVIGIKWCFSWSPLYLRILEMALYFTIAPAGRLITFKDTISHVESITTTSVMKTWSFQVM